LQLYLAVFMDLFSIHGRSMLDVFSPYYPFVAIILLDAELLAFYPGSLKPVKLRHSEASLSNWLRGETR
jgi:hypothetical protein